MAHLEVYAKSAIRAIAKEHTREAEEYKNFVDPDRKHLNYHFGETETAEQLCRKLEDRCHDVMQGRKIPNNTKEVGEWVVHYPERLCHKGVWIDHDKDGNPIEREYNIPNDPEHCKRFFAVVHEFNVARYGVENVLGEFVHMDETTPHLQCDIVSACKSRKTGKETISSASKFNLREQTSYQRDLAKAMVVEFGHEARDYVLNGRTTEGLSPEQIKERAETAAEFNNWQVDLVAQAEEIKIQYEMMEQDRQEIEIKKRQLAIKQQEIDQKEREVSQKDKSLDDERNELRELNNQSRRLNSDMGNVISFVEANKDGFNLFMANKAKYQEKKTGKPVHAVTADELLAKADGLNKQYRNQQAQVSGLGL